MASIEHCNSIVESHSEQQQQQQSAAAAARQVTPESPSRPTVERRPSHSSLRLEEDINEAIMPSYKNLGRHSIAQSNRAAATQIPHAHFTCPNAQLQSYLMELESRRQLCAQRNGGRLDLGTAEILNTIGLHYHHVTHDQKSALAYHQEALRVLQQIKADLLGPTCPRSSPALSFTTFSSTATDDEPPPLPGSTILTEEQQAHLNEVYVQTAITFTDIGNAYKSSGGDNDNALHAYNEALVVFRKIGMKEDHPRVAATLRCVKRIDQRFEGGTFARPSYQHSNS